MGNESEDSPCSTFGIFTEFVATFFAAPPLAGAAAFFVDFFAAAFAFAFSAAFS